MMIDTDDGDLYYYISYKVPPFLCTLFLSTFSFLNYSPSVHKIVHNLSD